MLSHVDYQFSTQSQSTGRPLFPKRVSKLYIPRDILEILRPLHKEDKRQIELKLDGGKEGWRKVKAE